jgi:DNA-binding transcriptional LysR family regulator
MELRHQRYFVAFAKELHFTRAAKRFGIKQPPLSLQIRQFEREMGTPLFRRETRGVKLIESGVLLPDEARRILDQGGADQGRPVSAWWLARWDIAEPSRWTQS